MKNPTATEVWNLRMMIVPPMHSESKMTDDQSDMKASVPPREDMEKMEIKS